MISYPSPEDEKKIFKWGKKNDTGDTSSTVKIGPAELLEIQKYIAESIRVDEKIYDYISDILEATRSRHREEWSDPGKKNDALSFRSMRNLAGKEQDISWSRYDGNPSILQYIEYWASTRAGLALIRCARVWALLEGRDYVLPEDIKSLAYEILRHRIGLSYEAVSEGITTDMIIKNILDTVRIP